MEDGLLSLKWNNHRSTFFHILSEVRGKHTYTDATLACEGKFFPVHKLVMSTCSDYFAEIFEKTPCKNPVVVLKDIKKSDLEALLDYMYIGEVDVRQSELAGLIKAAECLRIKGLAVPDEDPTKAQKKGPTSVPERREDSPPAKRKRRDSGGERGRAPSPPLPRGSSQSSSHTSTTPVPSQAPPPPSNVPESHVPSQSMPPPSSVGQEAGRPRPDTLPPSHLHHSQLSSMRAASSGEGLRSPPRGTSDSSHPAGASPRASDPSILPVQMIKVEVDEAGEHPGGGRDPLGEREEGSELDDNEEDASNDFSEYQSHPGEIEKEEHDQVDSYSTDQLPGPSGLQGGPPVLSWGEEGEGGFPHNLFGGDDAAAQQAVGAVCGAQLEVHGALYHPQQSLPPLPFDRLFTCAVCSSTFKRRWLLKRHMRTHTGEKPYKCSLCSYAAGTKQNLKMHLRKHTGEKPYACPHCPYRAAQRSDLKAHARTHSGDRPYSCPHCPYAAGQSAVLRRHLRVHADKQHYICPKCPFVATSQLQYNVHTLTHN